MVYTGQLHKLISIYEYGQHNYELKHAETMQSLKNVPVSNSVQNNVTSLCDKGLFSIYLTYRGSKQG